MKLISKTANGQVTFCKHHNHYHLEFGNLFLHLSIDDLQHLSDYVKSIDYQHNFNLNRESVNIRKVLLNIGSKRIFFLVNQSEFSELKNLLAPKHIYQLIQNKEIINLELNYN
jgi:hypothetical protein